MKRFNGTAVVAGLIAVLMFLCLALPIFLSCDEAAKYIINEVVETDTIIRDIDNEGKPWQIVDSLLTEIGELEARLDSCKGRAR